MRSLAREEAGQMAVELAVSLPILLLCGLIMFNLARFAVLCARFDRIAVDAVIAHGIAPKGEQTLHTALDQVHASIVQAMGNDCIVVEVSARPLNVSEDGYVALTGQLTRYSCEMSMQPWPSQLSIGGVSVFVPPVLRHECSLVVDRYRPGVLI